MTEFEHLRLQTTVRGAIIGYGIAAYAFLVPAQAAASTAHPFVPGGRAMLLAGIGLQALVLVGRAIARRHDIRRPGAPISPIAVFALELIADGVTVLLFALATYVPLVRFVG